jgi:hypothetical protein
MDMNSHSCLSGIMFGIIAFLIILISLSSPAVGISPSADVSDSDLQIISIDIPPEERTVYPGVTINPIITIQNKNNQTDMKISILLSVTLGPTTLLQNNTHHNAPNPGETREYRIPFMLPFIQPGTYALTISGEQKLRDGNKGILFGSMKSKTMIEVKQPRPEIGKKMCHCR